MKARGFSFEVGARDGAARRGRLATPHGTIETPAFMPVATFGAVRGLSSDDLRGLGAQILLSNTYHLHERPGEDVIAELGGLHGFTAWRGPWLTDSGGFQVTSLADRVRLDEDGVSFASTLDGKRRHLRPEDAVTIQARLGSDIAMVLDECLPNETRVSGAETLSDPTRARAAMERTLRWASRSSAARRREDQAVFGIVQGGTSLELRRESAEATADLGFDGHAHGGLGLGEAPDARVELIEAAHAGLPDPAPRYLMGIGRPEDIVAAVVAGVDLFDCVVPTRHARHGLLYTHSGLLAIKNARFRTDPEPLDSACDCPACVGYSRAYVAHLVRCGEALGARLATLHNLSFYLRLMRRARDAISEGRLDALVSEIAQISAVRV